jgi:hypothetical protein
MTPMRFTHQLADNFLWKLIEEAVHDQRSNDSALRVSDKHDLVDFRVCDMVEDLLKGETDIKRGVGKATLHETFEDIPKEARAVQD